MGKKPKKKPKIKLDKEQLKKRLQDFLAKVDPLKASAVVSGAYLIYKVLDTPAIGEAYSDIQLAGSPVLFALKRLGLFDPYKKAQEVFPFGKPEKAALSILGAYVIAEHGVDLVGAVGKAVAAT